MPSRGFQSASSRLLQVFVLVALLWLTHAIAFFAHEYAHSFTAWIAGCKANPLNLNYGHAKAQNFLLQSEIDENVDYDPVFAAHRGNTAALIAMAGVLFGNGLLYLVSRFGYFAARRRNRRNAALFCFLLLLMNVGNFLSYVPLRTFATHADMATVERGLRISPLWLIAFPVTVFLLALLWFEDRDMPSAIRFFYPTWMAGRAMLLVVCCAMLFGFFGSAGLGGYGSVSLALSRICVWVLLPCSLLLGWQRVRHRPSN